jgi:hypothetical protein
VGLGFFEGPNEELAVFNKAASVPSASVTSFSQSVLPVDMITCVRFISKSYYESPQTGRKRQERTCRR